jgi:hypothetical protein
MMMRKLVYALALLMMGGASLPAASAASVLPVASPVGKTVKAGGGLQLAYYRDHRRHFNNGYYNHGYYNRSRYAYYNRHRGFFFHGSFIFYPSGYYYGYCYDYPRDPWCRQYFYDRY